MRLVREARFWQFVKKRPGDGCWIYLGATQKGYGIFTYYEVGKQRNVKAHRFAWELVHGPIPKGLCVLHRCVAQRDCVRESHLYLGTHARNHEDRSEQGRTPTRPGKIVTREMVATIRAEYSALQEEARSRGCTRIRKGAFEALAKRFDLSKPGIFMIATGRTWRHV